MDRDVQRPNALRDKLLHHQPLHGRHHQRHLQRHPLLHLHAHRQLALWWDLKWFSTKCCMKAHYMLYWGWRRRAMRVLNDLKQKFWVKEIYEQLLKLGGGQNSKAAVGNSNVQKYSNSAMLLILCGWLVGWLVDRWCTTVLGFPLRLHHWELTLPHSTLPPHHRLRISWAGSFVGSKSYISKPSA